MLAQTLGPLNLAPGHIGLVVGDIKVLTQPGHHFGKHGAGNQNAGLAQNNDLLGMDPAFSGTK
jgi:hypothetical protein